MNQTTEPPTMKPTGWKPIPLPLKILAPVLVLWMVGSILNLPNLMENGLPFFGTFVYGATAAAIAVCLDIIGPILFLFALWNAKSWGAKWAFAYLGIFVLNSVVALFTVRDTLGLPQLLVPTIASLIFMAVIYWKRHYFNRRG